MRRHIWASKQQRDGVGLCNSIKLNKLQNSIAHIRHTVLQSIDRQHITDTPPVRACAKPFNTKVKNTHSAIRGCKGHSFLHIQTREDICTPGTTAGEYTSDRSPTCTSCTQKSHTTPCAVRGSSSSDKHPP